MSVARARRSGRATAPVGCASGRTRPNGAINLEQLVITHVMTFAELATCTPHVEMKPVAACVLLLVSCGQCAPVERHPVKAKVHAWLHEHGWVPPTDAPTGPPTEDATCNQVCLTTSTYV